MQNSRFALVLTFFCAAAFSAAPPAHGRGRIDMRSLVEPPQKPPRVRQPSDLLDLIPIVRDIHRRIPRQFSLASHTVKFLSMQQVLIEHCYSDPRVEPGARNAVISFSYSGSLGGRMATDLDVPLFHAPGPGLDGWAAYPLGNYTLRITRDGSAEPLSVYIKAKTRF